MGQDALNRYQVGVSGEELEASGLLAAYRPDYFVSSHRHAVLIDLLPPHEAIAAPADPPTLIHHDKDVLTVDHVPIASLPVPISVLVRVPVRIVPIVISVHCRSACTMHHGRAI